MIRTLLVDDEFYIRQRLMIIVDWNDLGFTIVGEAENGTKALEEIEKSNPHLLIADINMPGMDGLDLIREVKSRFPDIFVVFLTGYDTFEFAQHAINFGAVGYLLKPVNRAELVEQLEKVKIRISELESAKHGIVISKGKTPVKNLTVQQVKSIIEESYRMPDLSLDYIADKLGYNANYISGLFKKIIGISVVQYITNCRMEAAVKLMNEGQDSMTLADICEQVGYYDVFYFSKRFKELYGAPPSDYYSNIKQEKKRDRST